MRSNHTKTEPSSREPGEKQDSNAIERETLKLQVCKLKRRSPRYGLLQNYCDPLRQSRNKSTYENFVTGSDTVAAAQLVRRKCRLRRMVVRNYIMI